MKQSPQQLENQLQEVENAELNEHIKQYFSYNGFVNSLECFEAEVNAHRMSSKLKDKHVKQQIKKVSDEPPRLYSMLKDESIKTQREKNLNDNVKVFHKKYLEMLQTARVLFATAVNVVQDLSTFSQDKPEIQTKVEGYKKNINQFRRLVFKEGEKSEGEVPSSAELRNLKNKIIESMNQKQEQDLKNCIVNLRITALDCRPKLRQDYLNILYREDMLDLDNINQPQKTCYCYELLLQNDHFVKHQLLAIISIYLSSNEGIETLIKKDTSHLMIKQIITIFKEQENGSVTQRFCLAILQKMSLQPEIVQIYFEQDVVKNCLSILKFAQSNKIHSFCLEYSSALLVNIFSEKQILQNYENNKQAALLIIQGILASLNENFIRNTNKNILLALSRFKAEKFNELLIESLYDEKINEFLGKVSKLSDNEYKTEITTYHAKIFLSEQKKANFDMDKKQQLADIKKNQDLVNDGEAIIIFEHFNDELAINKAQLAEDNSKLQQK